jgi:hypothetical protein
MQRHDKRREFAPGDSMPTMRSAVTHAAAILAAVSLAACGRSPITPKRIEAAVESTFANLVDLQVSRLKLAPLPPPDFAVTAICRKQAAGSDTGAGDWTCTIVWQGPNRQTLRDSYDLSVGTDGCYSAAVEGDALGASTLKASDGTPVKNLLHAFEGCFDTTD